MTVRTCQNKINLNKVSTNDENGKLGNKSEEAPARAKYEQIEYQKICGWVGGGGQGVREGYDRHEIRK